MKKNPISFVLFITLLPLLMAMSSLQSQSPEKIPVPAKNYLATFTDVADVMTECQEVSIEGATFLEGKRGNGSNSISFGSIAVITFLQEGEKLTGTVKLKDGSSIQLALNKNQKAFGRTKYGTFQIKLSELKRLIFR